jgi:hypothetical protein
VKSYITYRRDEDRMHARVPMSAWLDEHVVVHVTVAVGRTGRLVPLSQREPQSSFLSSLFLFSVSFSLTSLHSPLVPFLLVVPLPPPTFASLNPSRSVSRRPRLPPPWVAKALSTPPLARSHFRYILLVHPRAPGTPLHHVLR